MKRILIVDDNKYIRFTLSELIEESGFNTHTAEDGNTALKEVHAFKPELIILDKRLPDCDGIDLLAEIKQIDSSVKVIILTAYADEIKTDQALKSGAFSILTKPFDNEEIITTIKKALDHK